MESRWNSGLSSLFINLNHARAANCLLAETLSSLNIDFCMVNEPYFLKNKIVGFPNKFNIIQFKEEPRAAIIICNPKLLFTIFYISREIVAIKLEAHGSCFLILSIYSPPLEDLRDKLQDFEDEPIVIKGDFNAKSSLWSTRNTDERGQFLLDFLSRTGASHK